VVACEAAGMFVRVRYCARRDLDVVGGGPLPEHGVDRTSNEALAQTEKLRY
jgi:hypothetical protein